MRRHVHVQVMRTERDGCYWIGCALCAARGPKKHSRILARFAFATSGYVR
jgi:hypothetical protein